MAAIFNTIRLENSPVFFVGMLVLNVLAINDDNLTYAFLGVVGALIGQIRFLAKRAEQDKTNTIKFITWEDVFSTFGWMLVGGFFPLVLSLPDVPKHILWVIPTPILALCCAPFVPKLWDVAEAKLPEILQNLLAKYTTKKGLENEQRKFEAREREREAKEQPTEGTTTTIIKGKENEQ